RCRRAAQPGAERDALVQRHGEAERQRQRFAKRDQRAARGVALGLQRQLPDPGDIALDGLDAHHGLVDPAHRGHVARAFDGMPEQVETDADIADACGRERARGCTHACTPRPVLSEWAIASTSPNTPAAVTCGPAPGPCTTSGLLA